jgi:hypothetical protein
LLHHLDEAAVTCGEVLCAKIQAACVTALARHAPAATTALVEQFDILAGGVQGLGSG